MRIVQRVRQLLKKPETEGERFWRLYSSGYAYRLKENDKVRSSRSLLEERSS